MFISRGRLKQLIKEAFENGRTEALNVIVPTIERCFEEARQRKEFDDMMRAHLHSK